MADYYETLAADYDWIFDDDTLARGLAINHPATARLLQRTSHASAVLDAACGTGINAAALARRGLAGSVWKPALDAGWSYDAFGWTGHNRHDDRRRYTGHGDYLPRARDGADCHRYFPNGHQRFLDE